jgi:secreted trypsin-like serine protease
LGLACIAAPAGAVIGGQQAAPGAWPFAAALIDASVGDTLAGQVCGAVVVSPTEVMTAAHCVVSDGSTHPRKRSLDVVAGRLRLRGAASLRIHVVSVRVHPAFDPQTLANDLAILELATPASGSAQLDDGTATAAGGVATALGWGSMTASGTGDFPDAMRQTALSIEPDASCTDAYGDGYDAATMLCAGIPAGGHDTCQGDSGGPLVAAGAEGAVVIGFTSFGGACGQAGAPGAYVRAAIAASWLAAGGTSTAERTATLPLRRAHTRVIRPLAKPRRPRAKAVGRRIMAGDRRRPTSPAPGRRCR